MSEIIGPSPGWEPGMQRTGRKEMARWLRKKGPRAAADYAKAFEQYANEWLVSQGFTPGFVFKPIAMLPITLTMTDTDIARLIDDGHPELWR